MKLNIILAFSLAATLHAQSDFHASTGTENMMEGGSVQKLTIVSSNLQFGLRPPPSWTRQVDEGSQKIVFTSPSGKSALTVLFTSNFAGQLPEKAVLKQMALQAHPGAAIVQCAICPTSYQPGVFVDLARMVSPHSIQRYRHAFVAEPGGEVEFILSASDDEFDKDRMVIMPLLRSFKVDVLKTKSS